MAITPADLQSDFISAQICFLEMGRPLLVRNMAPEAVFSLWAN